MSENGVLHQRILHQGLNKPLFETPCDVVKYFGAVQAQDYSSAKWGVCLRMKNPLEKEMDEAFDEGKILRTHFMRPTWHLVAPEDLNWIQQLTSPRVKSILSHYDRKMGVDSVLLKRAHTIFENALRKNDFLTRNELKKELSQKGILADGQKLAHLIMHAELDALLCSGPRNRKQFTYALVENRVRKPLKLTRDEALAELTKRYFTSHGPATIHDMGWWSGLPLHEVKKGIERNGHSLMSETLDGKIYWRAPNSREDTRALTKAHLLPIYDEFFIGYKNSSHVYRELMEKKGDKTPHIIFNNALVIGENVKGTWKKTIVKKNMEITISLFSPLRVHEKPSLEEAVKRYGSFLGVRTGIHTI